MSSMMYGFIAVMIGMYLLFTIELKSYLQPLLVLILASAGYYLLAKLTFEPVDVSQSAVNVSV